MGILNSSKSWSAQATQQRRYAKAKARKQREQMRRAKAQRRKKWLGF